MIASRTACAFALALLALAPWTGAQLPEGPEIAVLDPGPVGYRQTPRVAVAPSGFFTIVWSGRDADGEGVFAQRFAADGSPRGEGFRVNPRARGRQLQPAVAFGPDGGMVVVWTNVCYRPPCPVPNGVLARIFGPDGTPLGDELRVNLTATGVQLNPAVAFDPDGNFLVTWSDEQNDPNDVFPFSRVLGRRFAPDGTPLGPQLELSTATELGGGTTALAFAPDGGFAVAWDAYVGEGTLSDVFVRVFAPDATPRSDPLRANSEQYAETGQVLGGLAMAAGGEHVVVWDSSGQDHLDPDPGDCCSSGIYARRFAADGSPLGDEFPVNTTVVGNQELPAIAMTPEGDFLVTWTDGYNSGLDGDREGIFGQWFAADGTRRGSEFQINGRPWGRQRDSAVALTPQNDAIVAWTEVSSTSPEFSQNVVARWLKAACTAGETTLCPAGGRFRVELAWADFEGHADYGTAQPLTADSGTFWFFDPDNLELAVKVLDGRGVNGHFWVFYGALTNLAYTVTVSDTATDRQKIYRNPATEFASVGDAAAFADPVAGAALGPVAGGRELLASPGKAECPAGRLCLGPGDRFHLTLAWQDFGGRTGTGMPVPLTADSGYFWFFEPDNVELMVKVLDGRAINGYFWVFYASLSNLEYTLTVTDVLTGEVREYVNPLGTFASAGDVRAFRPPPPDPD